MARKTKGAGRGFSKFRSKWWALCRIDRLIRAVRASSVASLAEQLEVDPRTIRRYIAFMRQELGAPIEYNPIDERYELTDTTWTMPNVALTDKEMIALVVATSSISGCAPEPYAKHLRDLTAKLLDALPLDERREIAALSAKVDFVPASVPAKGHEWVEPLIGAIRDRLTVEMDYWALSKQKLTQRRVDPYHLRHFAGAWYLIGYDHQTRYLPVFHLARVKRLTLTDDRFKPERFDASVYFRNTFGITAGGTPKLVRVRLTGRAARTADERQWPPGFTYTTTGGAEGVLSGKVGRMDDILAWAAGFRGDAEVLPG
jgi:predicted DNA-binding transcriptional regulator YafY